MAGLKGRIPLRKVCPRGTEFAIPTKYRSEQIAGFSKDVHGDPPVVPARE